MQPQPTKILRLPQVRERVGLSTSTIYSMMAKGLFPQQVPLNVHSVGWVEEEIDDFITARIAKRVVAALKNLKDEPKTADEPAA
jgi:prophage regulatory protein